MLNSPGFEFKESLTAGAKVECWRAIVELRLAISFLATCAVRKHGSDLGSIVRIEATAEEAARKREIVAYCRGPYCVMATEAVELLRGKGYRATRIDLGVPEWRKMGFPIEVTSQEVQP